MEMDIIKTNLKAAFEKPGCPICRLRQEAEIAYIQTLLYEYVNDGYTRLGFVRSRGACPWHAWLLQASEQIDWGDGLKTAPCGARAASSSEPTPAHSTIAQASVAISTTNAHRRVFISGLPDIRIRP